MKVIFSIFLIVAITTFLSCNKDSGTNPDDIGGDTNVPINQVGNTFSTSVKSGNNYYDVNENIIITKSEGGVVTIKINADLKQFPALAKLNSIIPASMKDANGKVDAELKFKVTSEGIQDYVKEGKSFTIAKFSDAAGTKYSLSRSDGKTSTRTVTEKTDQNDFSYGFFLIKTSKIEQPSNTPGVSKYVFRVNHKYGLVFWQIVMEDGSSVESLIYPRVNN